MFFCCSTTKKPRQNKNTSAKELTQKDWVKYQTSKMKNYRFCEIGIRSQIAGLLIEEEDINYHKSGAQMESPNIFDAVKVYRFKFKKIKENCQNQIQLMLRYQSIERMLVISWEVLASNDPMIFKIELDKQTFMYNKTFDDGYIWLDIQNVDINQVNNVYINKQFSLKPNEEEQIEEHKYDQSQYNKEQEPKDGQDGLVKPEDPQIQNSQDKRTSQTSQDYTEKQQSQIHNSMNTDYQSLDSTKCSVNTTSNPHNQYFDKIEHYVEDLKRMSQKMRKDKEQQYLKDKMENKNIGPTKYCLSVKWAVEYTEYLQGKKEIDVNNFPIDNTDIVDANGELKQKLKDGKDYQILNDISWHFLRMLYGGGPQVKFQVRSHQRLDSRVTKNRQSLGNDYTIQNIDIYGTLIFYPVGLQNTGLFCYMNAVLQCLLSIPQLNYFFSDNQHYKGMKNSKKSQKLSICHGEMVQAMKGVQKPNLYFPPNDIERLIKKQFYYYDQHDSQEFLRFYLSELQDELTPFISQAKIPEFKDPQQAYSYYCQTHPGIIDKLFTGQYESKVICQKCNHQSVAFDPFLDLSVPISKQRSRNKSVYDCLNQFFEPEDLSEDYKCEKCKKVGQTKRYMKITNPPKILTIHLKRFKMYPKVSKINDMVKFPVKDLDIQKYCFENTEVPTTYKLLSLVQHQGTPNCGHYVSFAKREKS